MDKTLFAAPLCLLCLAAALSASLPAALLYIAVLTGILLLTILCAALFKPTGAGWRLAFCLLLDAALGAGVWMLLGYDARWQTWAGPALLFMLAALLCAPAAIQLNERAEHGDGILSPLLLLRAAGILLLTGAVRELLSAGTLYRVRITASGLSDSFGLGAAGVLIAGVLLLLCGTQERHFYHVPLRRGFVVSLTAALRTAAAGVVPALLLMLRPDLPLWLMLPITTVCTGLLSALGLLLCKGDAVRAVLADGVTAAIGAVVMTNAVYAGGEWITLLAPLWCGALFGMALWLWTGIYSRIDSLRMPVWARGGPAAVVTAGVCLLAFSVLQ